MDAYTRRATGSYYTSADTAQYMTDWLIDDKHLNILEPTAGDGVFIESLQVTAKFLDLKLNITAVELETKPYESLMTRRGVKAVHSDFHLFNCPPVDAVIGNPPFVRFRHLSKKDLGAAEKAGRAVIGRDLDISGSIWLSIILHAIQAVKVNGKIAFVIPADSVYVRYARPFWEYICNHFGNVRVVRCQERLFPEILQDVILLFADSFGMSTNSVTCEDFETFEDVIRDRSTGVNVIPIGEILSGKKPFMKVHMSISDRKWLEEIEERCQKAIEYAKFNIGYVSGNKKYFHPSEKDIKEFSIPKASLKDAVVTARKLSKSGYLTSEIDEGLEKVWLPNPKNISPGEAKYIRHGSKLGFDAGHKTGGRSPWYVIPGVVIPDILLTVFGELPRLLINDSKVPASNSILIGRFKNPFPTEEFLMLWYSSVTRLGIELSVHSLGGGVLVMVPREGDSVMMPKPVGKKVPSALLKKLNKALQANDMKAAYEIGDDYLLNAGWNQDDISKCKKLATEFMLRRKK
jgi:adenine-specific DNA-methyltransferase